MRVLLTSFAVNTHYFNLVPMAWALSCAGHDVRVAAQPALTEAITGSGLTAVPVGTDDSVLELFALIGGDLTVYHRELDFTFTRPETLTWDYQLGVQVVTTGLLLAPVNGDDVIDGLVDYARFWRPDLIVWEPMTMAGAVAARASGAAHARLLWGPDVLGAARREFLRLWRRRPPPHRDDPLAEWLAGTLERFGHGFDEDMVTGQWTIDPTPPGCRLPLGLPTVSTRFVPYHGTSVVPDWLYGPAERPRVCVTLGVSAREDRGSDFVPLDALLEAMADLDVEVVATLNGGQREELSAVPDNVRLVDFVPLNALLPGCAAIVHHGGSGTWQTAALHGVPQITLPNLWDAPLKGRQMEKLGAGLTVPPDRLTPGLLRDAVVRVLKEPSFAEAAARMRAEMLAEPSPAEIVPTLERLAARHRKGSGR
ncbi:DUF1205 domain-containing protein [Actinomadura viridis]|uniref:Glycosyltransferase (Activator-dependent family) n=1 Tax=Actinomadura viridis TaxID=58110 RepID=A0A931GNY1_9ACTN|nr:activator-dependent family glycosyltransferase [Actinomadura viridis]MBG6086854.1 glycosyltransferase (activator-dependent family) [Actinomadura viridis]